METKLWKGALVIAEQQQKPMCKLAGECTTGKNVRNSIIEPSCLLSLFYIAQEKVEKRSKAGKPPGGISSSHLWIQKHMSSATWKHTSCLAFDGERVKNLKGSR